MNELLNVIQREYLTRVRTRSFILISLLSPIALSLLLLLPTYFSTRHEDYKSMKIGLVNAGDSLMEVFGKTELSVESLGNRTSEEIKKLIATNKCEGIVNVARSDSTGIAIQYYTNKQPSIYLLNQIKAVIQKSALDNRLNVYGINNVDSIIKSVRASVSIESIKIDAGKGETVNSPYQRPLGLALGLMVYLFIFLFSSQVMRGVLEEKSNRIVELIITSISPIKFMAGKIIGIALLGLTQIICWIVVMYGITLFVSDYFGNAAVMGDFATQRINQDDINQILSNLNLIDFNAIIPAFIFFFIGGYLLYSSVFAAIAATVSHSDDIQQMTTIVTLPLILSILVLTNTINSPDSSLSYWFSIIPFTSPVVMMGRIVYGAPIGDVLLSVLFLITTIIVIIWISGKIYKMAILYSGKKLTWRNIFYWIINKNN